jgi:hypothetical protein
MLKKRKKKAEEEEKRRRLDALNAATSFEALPEDVKKLIKKSEVKIADLKDPNRFQVSFHDGKYFFF